MLGYNQLQCILLHPEIGGLFNIILAAFGVITDDHIGNVCVKKNIFQDGAGYIRHLFLLF